MDIFADDGVSAVACERPQFAAAFVALRPTVPLVIWKMDHAFRSLLHALQVLEALESRGVAFHSLAIDTATPMGRFAYRITNAFAELERALIIERTRAGLAAARRRRVQLGRPPKLTDTQVADGRSELSRNGRTLAHIAGELGVSTRTRTRTRALGR